MQKGLLEEFRRAAGLTGTRFPEFRHPQASAVAEAADAPDLPRLPFLKAELDARLTDIQKRWLITANSMSETVEAMRLLLKPVEEGYWELDTAHSQADEPSDDLSDTRHAYHAIYATLKDIIEHFQRRGDDFEQIASWFEPRTARKAPTSGAPRDLKGM